MLIDLHTHTLHYSTDSSLSLGELLGRARERGLDGVCLTEHNAVWPVERLETAAQRHGLLVLRGMEVSTDRGHVLVFGLEGFTVEMLSLERLRTLVDEAGAAMVLAHPLRESGSRLDWHQLPRFFHAVEVLNGSDANGANAYLASLAQTLALPGTGGSDAHSPYALGSCATRFLEPVHTEAELVQALRAGRFEAVDLREAAPISRRGGERGV
ncbi:MAG: PHP domain-containing protein [Chloroflexi bacterium]|nr:PHP domain-containing protein [Chloroflexota bacterium]